MSTLVAKKCRPLPAGTPALARAQIDALLKEVPGWAYDGKVIAKSWSFKNNTETMVFVKELLRDDGGRERGRLARASRGPSPRHERRLQPLPGGVQHALDRRNLRERFYLRGKNRSARVDLIPLLGRCAGKRDQQQ